jgi:biopolymer transport protein ExbB
MLGKDARRQVQFWAVVSLAVLGLVLGSTCATWSQEPEERPDKAVTKAAPAASEEPARQQSFLAYIFWASPSFFVIMAGLSIYLVERVVSNMMKLRLVVIAPPQLLTNMEAMLGEKKFKEAYDMLRSDTSLFGRALVAGVERLSQGFDRGMDALVSVSEDGKMDLEHKISPIATIGAVAPMLGLLGTVLGMIMSFQKIALGGQPKPAELAEGIGLALVSTLEGLVVAVPAIVFFGFFRNRIARLIFEVESVGETYLWRFAGALKK